VHLRWVTYNCADIVKILYTVYGRSYAVHFTITKPYGKSRIFPGMARVSVTYTKVSIKSSTLMRVLPVVRCVLYTANYGDSITQGITPPVNLSWKYRGYTTY